MSAAWVPLYRILEMCKTRFYLMRYIRKRDNHSAWANRDNHIAWANRVSEGFLGDFSIACTCILIIAKMNTRQQTLYYSFEAHQNVFIRKDGHLPFICMTQQRDM